MSTYIDGIRILPHLGHGQALVELEQIAARIHRTNVASRCGTYLEALVGKGLSKAEIWERVHRVPMIRQNSGLISVAVVEGRTVIAFNGPLAGLRQATEHLAEDYSYTDAVSMGTETEHLEYAERARVWQLAENSFEEYRFDAEPIISELIDHLFNAAPPAG